MLYFRETYLSKIHMVLDIILSSNGVTAWIFQAQYKASLTSMLFEGRASRSEFWYAQLFIILTSFFLEFIEGLLGISPFSEVSILASIFQLGILIPSIAIIVRRLHDINKSGYGISLYLPLLVLFLSFTGFAQREMTMKTTWNEPLDLDKDSENSSIEPEISK